MAKHKTKSFACDIISSVPWECGDRDCPVQWHLASYWIDDSSETGFTVDNYSDGDHDLCEKNEVPTFEQETQAWHNYARYVIQFGKDPLKNYMVKHSHKVKEKWEFKFNYSILGLVCVAARHAGKLYNPENLPDHVRQYLNLPDKGRAVLGDFKGKEGEAEFVKICPKFWQWNVQHIEHDIPRKPALVTKELKRLARKHLREKS